METHLFTLVLDSTNLKMKSLDSISSLPPIDLEKWLHGPALTPPQGEVPSFDSPSNKNHLAQIILTTGLVLSTFVVLIRVYSRLFCMKKFEVEDCEPPPMIVMDRKHGQQLLIFTLRIGLMVVGFVRHIHFQ